MKQVSIVLGLIFCLAAGPASAQTIVMEQDVNRDTIESSWGPNRKHYLHRYVGFGLGLGTEARKLDGQKLSDVKYGFGTGQLAAGLRYKYRVGARYALGLDLGYNRTSFNFRQRDDKFFPTSGRRKKERLYFHNLALEAYQRVNFDPTRGDYLGKYLDLGVFGEWNFDNTLFTVDKLDSANVNGARRVKTKQKNLNYINRFHYGLSARLGTNRFGLYARYRLSDLLDSKKLDGYPDLPRLLVGFQIAL